MRSITFFSVTPLPPPHTVHPPHTVRNMAATASCCYCGNAAVSRAPTPSFSSSSQSRPKLSCQPCAARRLASQISRYRSALELREVAREDCLRRLLATRLRRPPDAVDDDSDDAAAADPRRHHRALPDPNRIHKRVSRLRRRLDGLHSTSNELAVRVAARTMENDEREEMLRSDSEKVRTARERLDRMGRCLLDDSGGAGGGERKRTDDDGGVGTTGGGLRDALLSGTREIRTLRFHLASRVFDMHRLDVGEDYDGDDGGSRKGHDAAVSSKIGNEGATGVGRIGGLPLPHAGPVLYGVIPPAVLASSLRLVASLTQLVARCLGVVLPHPILVCFEECRKCGEMCEYASDVIDVSNDRDRCDDDSDDDEEYLGGDDGRTRFCGACLNEGMSKNSPTEKSPPQHSGSVPQSQESRRPSFLAIVGSSARRVVSLTTSATSRAITHMQQQSSSASGGTALPSGNQHDHRPPLNGSSSNGSNDVLSAFAGSTKAVSMSPDSISRRINHASFAYLRESQDVSATEYVLNPPRWGDESGAGGGDGGGGDLNNGRGGGDAVIRKRRPPPARLTYSNREEFHVAEERFATGLQLLQNDIVALCFRAGVDVPALWPAESVLLNLHSLWRHCRQMAESGNIY